VVGLVEKTEGKFCPEFNRFCLLMQVESEIRDWLFKLQDNKRLNIALKAFKAIDQQMQIGADVREVVGQVLREIRDDFGNVKDDMSLIVSDVKETMDKSVKDYLQNIVEQAKTAERIIVDLKDKVQKFSNPEENISTFANNKIKEESLSALEVLGIPKRMSEKLADKIMKQDPNISVEELVKQILKNI